MSVAIGPFGVGAPGPDYARDPFPCLTQLRDVGPRHYLPAHNAWCISDRAAIVALLRDDRLDILPSTSFKDRSPAFRAGVVAPLRAWFAASRAELTQTADAVAEHAVVQLAGCSEGDLVGAIASHVPTAVMAALLGIPAGDIPPLRRLSDEVLHSYDLAWEGRPEAGAIRSILPAYFANHWRSGGDTPVMRLLREAQARDGLDDASMVDTCAKLFTAGTTTTAGCIANVLARQIGGSTPPADAAADTLEQLLRLDVPVLAIKRRVRETVELDDCVLEPGQLLLLFAATANRTPPPPGQRPEPSLTFGMGRHHCLGALLARVELAAVLDRLAPLLPRISLSGPVTWREAWLVHEARSIPITIEGESRANRISGDVDRIL